MKATPNSITLEMTRREAKLLRILAGSHTEAACNVLLANYLHEPFTNKDVQFMLKDAYEIIGKALDN